MKVILTGDMYQFSGAEASILSLLDELQSNSVESLLIVPEFRDEQIKSENVRTFKVPFKRPASSEEIYLKLGNPIFQLLYVKFLIQQIQQFKPDILHSAQYFSTPATWLASKITKVPFVAHVRDYRLVCSVETCFKRGEINFCGDNQRFLCLLSETKSLVKSIYGVLLVRLMRYFFQGSKKIMVVSDFVGQIMQKILKRSTITIYNIVRMDYKPKRMKPWERNGFHILYFGRLSPSKGVQILLKVVEKMNKTMILHVAGSGELSKTVKEHARKMRKIVYRGYVPHPDLYDLIASVDLVILPSLWPDPLPRTIIESQLIGTPVIASKVGGIPEILPSCCLFEPDEHDLRRKMEEVEENPEKYRTKVNCKLNPDSIMKGLLEIYEDCSKKK